MVRWLAGWPAYALFPTFIAVGLLLTGALDTEHRASHLFMVSALALVIWVTLALLVGLDYPFNGVIRVTDAPLHDFLASVAR
jgi:hypothetical protein